jgi:hypothetical protein
MKGGVGKDDAWPPAVGNSWRTTDDIQDNWHSMLRNINSVRYIGNYLIIREYFVL